MQARLLEAVPQLLAQLLNLQLQPLSAVVDDVHDSLSP